MTSRINEEATIDSDENVLTADTQDDGDSGDETLHTSALAAFQSRPFAWFWPSLALSLTGVWIRITAFGYLVYDITDDEFLLGLVSFASAAPVLLASPIAGAIIDRIDRRRVLQVVQSIQGISIFILALLVVTDTVAVWHIFFFGAVVGFASGFDWPARLSIIPLLVQKSQLRSAVALTAAAFNGSRIIGPAIGGIVAGLVGIAACFFLNPNPYSAMYIW